MDTVKIELDLPKELFEVKVAVVELLKDILAGKGLPELVGENLSNLSKAVGGADKLDDEIKEDLAASLQCAGLFGADIVSALLKK